MPDESPQRQTEPDAVGTVEFTVGPARHISGGRNGKADDRPLLELAVIASEYGKTLFIDSCGSSVIFGGVAESDVDLW